MSRQLPSDRVAAEFGEVNVATAADGSLAVSLTILMEPQGEMAEGWQTGVALDASASMMGCYGRVLEGGLPDAVTADYLRRGWAHDTVTDGQARRVLTEQAIQAAMAAGYIRWSANTIEPIAREFIGKLADGLDADGGTTVIYWAGGDGRAIEEIGDRTGAQIGTLSLPGPSRVGFGAGTFLVPALDYFVTRFADAKRGLYVFVTDGRLDDLEAVKARTHNLATEIAAGRRGYLKCVLVGLGDAIDEAQMTELDDLDTGTSVDIWDHKIAREMRGLNDLFAEVVDENSMVADAGAVYDSAGRLAKRFSDGLPAKLSFELPAGSRFFELEVAGTRIRQSLV